MEPKLLNTKLNWEDLILSPKTAQLLELIYKWNYYNKALLQDWSLDKKIKPGFSALFYGPSGTGKSITAALLGKRFDKPVYRIDLSQVISKYIGETEKNLERVFDAAENKEWILFFDEADALFGKRTSVEDAHDRYANQQISYLLRRIEEYEGLAILATNLKSNLDPAFTRRFNILIPFPLPEEKEREQLWQRSISPKASFSKEVNVAKLASKYELSGSAIMNVIHYASLQALSKNTNTLTKADILEGIKQEHEKEGRNFE